MDAANALSNHCAREENFIRSARVLSIQQRGKLFLTSNRDLDENGGSGMDYGTIGEPLGARDLRAIKCSSQREAIKSIRQRDDCVPSIREDINFTQWNYGYGGCILGRRNEAKNEELG